MLTLTYRRTDGKLIINMKKKKRYIIPETTLSEYLLATHLMGLSAPDEGIHDGGEGGDDDDPTAKQRNQDIVHWGNIW